jgi:hypothetical protein
LFVIKQGGFHMQNVFRRIVALVVLLAAAGLFPFTDGAATACPSCKAANETNARLPRAYMYSILFMLGMPATVFAGFGISFYRMTRNGAADQSPSDEQQTDSETKH